MSGSVRVQKLLLAILERLEQESIPYLVMRNHQGYPHHVTGDVDLALSAWEFDRAREAVEAAAIELGWGVFMHAQRPYVHYLGLVADAHPERFVLVVEFFASGTWYWMPFLECEQILMRRQRGESCWGPSPGDEAAMTAFHHLLWNKRLPKKYHRTLPEQIAADSAGFANVAAAAFGSALGHRIQGEIESGRWESVEQLASTMRRALTKRALIRRPWAFFLGIAKTAFSILEPTPGIEIELWASDAELRSRVAHEMMDLAERWHIFLPGRRLHISVSDPRGAKRWRARLAVRRGGFVLCERASEGSDRDRPDQLEVRIRGMKDSGHSHKISRSGSASEAAWMAWQWILGSRAGIPLSGGAAQ